MAFPLVRLLFNMVEGLFPSKSRLIGAIDTGFAAPQKMHFTVIDGFVRSDIAIHPAFLFARRRNTTILKGDISLKVLYTTIENVSIFTAETEKIERDSQMQSDQIWGLQQLKKNLKGSEKEAFTYLERNLLDLLHRQRLYRNSEALEREKEEIIQNLEVLSQNNVHKSFADLCIVPTSDYSIVDSSLTNEPIFTSLVKANNLLDFPLVEVNLLTEFVPIAFCYQKDDKEYPLITLHINNTYLQSMFIANVRASFEGYSEPAERQIKILPGSQQKVSLLPLIGKERMKEIKEQCPVTLRVEIEYISPLVSRWPFTKKIHFLSRNAAILWKCQEDGSLIDCTEHLAAWVTPNHSAIKKLAREALEYHPEKGFRGYNVLGTREERSEKVREQVRAIFNALHQIVRIRYLTSSEMIQPKMDKTIQKIQLVRLPSEVLESGGAANCIDGTVLFASLLECINLHPLLFLQPGHALIGWRVFRDDSICEFLETTSVDTGDFDLAFQKGQGQFEQACLRGALGRTIIDPQDYAFVVDIADCRRENIQPMDW